MSHYPSFVHQVHVLFKGALAVGTKRHHAKARLRAQGRRANTMGEQIHSFHSFQTYRSRCIAFAEWTKAKYHTRHLANLTPEMVRDYLETRKQQGYQRNTLASDLTALRWLEKLCLKQGILSEKLIPTDLHLSREFSPRGAYTLEEADALIAEVRKRNPLAAQVLHVQLRFGLRLSEVVSLKHQLFKHQYSLERMPGIHLELVRVFVKGKGGLQRLVGATHADALDGIQTDVVCPLLPDGWAVKSWKREIQRLVHAACLALEIIPRGTHGLRATAAREFHALRRAAGATEEAADQETAAWLGHGRTNVLRHYFKNRG